MRRGYLGGGRAAADDGDRGGLAAALPMRTKTLHARAERSGIVRDILRGQVSRDGYAVYLRNLLPAYQAMERGLEALRAAPGVRHVVFPALFRSEAIAGDLASMCGGDWADAVPLLPAGARYAARVAEAAADGARLIGHAYTRQLGDLSGAVMLARALAGVLGPEAMAFFAFPGIVDRTAFKALYRAGLDRAAAELGGPDAVISEAQVAFACNIEVSEAAGGSGLGAVGRGVGGLKPTLHLF